MLSELPRRLYSFHHLVICIQPNPLPADHYRIGEIRVPNLVGLGEV